MSQDSSHPTGVAGPANNQSTRARERKANSALALRIAGASWEEICDTLGYPTSRTALVAVERSLEEQLKGTDKDRMRKLADMRLDRLLRSVWSKAIDPDHPEQMVAIARARELIGQHIKLFGLDAPTEVVVHSPSQTELEQWVAKVVSTSVPPVEEFDILEGEIVSEQLALESGL